MELRNDLMLALPSKVQQVDFPLYEEYQLNISVKRDDLIHPEISGNKWRKLKHNIAYAKDKCYRGILTFGGAFSNHLHACAFACQSEKLQMIAMIRGDRLDENNPTLRDLKNLGVRMQLLDRKQYRLKEDETFLDELMQEYPDFYIVPEGGNNDLGIEGVQEMLDELSEIPDHIFVPAGRGSTAIGIAKGIEAFPKVKLHVITCVNDSGLNRYVEKKISNPEQVIFHNEYSLGGFAKVNADHVAFINRYFRETSILLDPIYNAKSFSALHALIKDESFAPDDHIMMIHTGGLQGINGHNYRYRHRPEMIIERLSHSSK